MTLFDLIRANQHEQEKFIVEMIVNKLGDPDYQVSAKIVYNVKNYCKLFQTNTFWIFVKLLLIFTNVQQVIKCPKMKMEFIK